MGIFKKFKLTSSTPKRTKSKKNRKKSIFSFSPSDVTEESLEVWRHLPSKIRQDPSMASFQMQQERLHGNLPEDEENDNDDDDDDDDEELDDQKIDDNDSIGDQSEFITIKVTSDQGKEKNLDDITSTELKPLASTSTGPSTPSTKIEKDDTFHDTGQPPVNNLRVYSKMVFLFVGWLLFTIILTSKKEKTVQMQQLAISPESPKNFYFNQLPKLNHFVLTVTGAFEPKQYTNETTIYLSVVTEHVIDSPEPYFNNSIETIAEEWRIPIVNTTCLEETPVSLKHHDFEFNTDKYSKILEDPRSLIRLKFNVNSKLVLPIKIGIDYTPINMHTGSICAAALLILLYGLIIWDVVHRTFAAVIVSTMSVATCAFFDDRPSMKEIVEWIDVETLLLLFCMMILVALLTETGIFDFVAVYTYKITNGKIWPLIHCLCVVTALVSAFLDNVTTVLLMTPVTIRLCEVMELNPIPVLMGIIVHANIGGTMTPIGDPPNIIITSNHYIAKHGITFLNFTLHMAVGVFICIVQTFIHLRIQYRNINDLRFKEPKMIKNLRREITVWERAAASLSPFSKNGELVRQTLNKKVKILKHQLKKALSCSVSTERYKTTLEELQHAYPIKNKCLLLQSGFALIFIICLFFIQSVPSLQRLSLGWCSLLGVMLLLIITKRDDMDALMHRIEWTTLLFFAAMFVITECLGRLGLINWIGKLTERIIMSVSEDSRLAVAIIIILWISALTSAFVDSIPVTTMMVKIVVSLAENKTLGLPLQPLVWALAFGPCLGGNGTLVGASANVVCAGIAEQHGYRFSFIEYFKVGFPIMLGSVVVITGYLMFSHVLLSWH